MTHWLTDTDKTTLVTELELCSLDVDGGGGVQLCGALNALDGVCVLFACSGHYSDSEGRQPEPGYLVLCLSEAMTGALDEHIVELISHERFRVSKLYRYNHGAVTQQVIVGFSGLAHAALETSAGRLIEFFTRLSTHAGGSAGR